MYKITVDLPKTNELQGKFHTNLPEDVEQNHFKHWVAPDCKVAKDAGQTENRMCSIPTRLEKHAE